MIAKHSIRWYDRTVVEHIPRRFLACSDVLKFTFYEVAGGSDRRQKNNAFSEFSDELQCFLFANWKSVDATVN